MSPRQHPDRPTKKERRDGHINSAAHTKKPTRITDYFTTRDNKTSIEKREENKRQQERRQNEDKAEREETEAEWWGDKMDQKQSGTIRLFFQNLNGIKYDQLGGEMGWYGHYMAENEIDILGIAEHNVDNCSPSVVLATRQALHRIERNFSLTIGGTTTKMETPYKPGGTLTVARGNIRGRIMERGSDKLGRWTYVRIRGKQGKSLWVLTVYQVCKSSPTAGLTASAQQLSLVRQHGDKATPRDAFKRDLTKFVTDTIGADDEIVIMGDFNEEIGADSEGIVRIMEEGGLAEMMTARHQKPLPATFERGKDCIDYVLASPRILQAITHAGYTPQSGGLFSDHRGLFMDIDIETALGGILSQMPTATGRTFAASSPALVTKYLEAATEALAHTERNGKSTTTDGKRHAGSQTGRSY